MEGEERGVGQIWTFVKYFGFFFKRFYLDENPALLRLLCCSLLSVTLVQLYCLFIAALCSVVLGYFYDIYCVER